MAASSSSSTPAPARPPTLGEQVREALGKTEAYRRYTDEDMASLYGAARSLMNAGRFDKAQSLLMVCSLYRPHEPRYLTALGTCHRQLQQLEKAVQAFSMACAMDPMHYDAALQMGECLLRLRQADLARRVLTALVECGKHAPDAVIPAARAKVLLELAVPA
jgi:predicted Zn-dependent protease